MGLSGFLRHRLHYPLSFPRLSAEVSDAAVLDLMEPGMARLSRERLVRSWFFESGGDPTNRARSQLNVFVRPARGVSAPALDAAFARAFAGIGAHGGRVDYERPPWPAAHMESRFGGQAGIRLFESFAPRQTRLLLEMRGAWRRAERPCSRSQLALAALLYQLEPLAGTREEAVLGLKRWLEGFGRLLKIEPAAAAEGLAERLLDTELASWLDSCGRREPSAFGACGLRHARAFRRIGRLLRAKTRGQARSTPFRIMHFAHGGFLSLGVLNTQEFLLESLALAWLSSRPA